MKNIDQELINWAVDTIEKKYKDDVVLLIGQVGACKIPTDEQTMAFDYFVPATEKGYQLAKTFIIEDMGYDLYPMSFERLEGIANFEEPRMLWVLEKSEIIYARNVKDKHRFDEIKKRMHDNLQNKSKTMEQALEFLNIAMEVYTTMQFEKDLCKVRKAAGGVSSMLTYALAMINGIAVVDGCGNMMEQVEHMTLKPACFGKIYKQMLKANTIVELCNCCRELIQAIRDFINDLKKSNQQKNIESDRECDNQENGINYLDLAYWYQEARYTFRRIAYFAEQKESARCFSLGCYLQIEFDAIQDEFALQKMDLLSSFEIEHLDIFEEKAKELETYIVDVIEGHHVEMNKFDSLEEFLDKQKK